VGGLRLLSRSAERVRPSALIHLPPVECMQSPDSTSAARHRSNNAPSWLASELILGKRSIFACGSGGSITGKFSAKGHL
jgi:hypothetical protein